LMVYMKTSRETVFLLDLLLPVDFLAEESLVVL
jgi:hypothetical protein